MSLKNTGGDTLASYGTTVTIGQDANDKSRIYIDDNSVDLIVDDSGTDTNYASFGSIVRIGDVANEHISASSAGIHIKDGSTVNTLINAKGATFGESTSTQRCAKKEEVLTSSVPGRDQRRCSDS